MNKVPRSASSPRLHDPHVIATGAYRLDRATRSRGGAGRERRAARRGQEWPWREVRAAFRAATHSRLGRATACVLRSRSYALRPRLQLGIRRERSRLRDVPHDYERSGLPRDLRRGDSLHTMRPSRPRVPLPREGVRFARRRLQRSASHLVLWGRSGCKLRRVVHASPMTPRRSRHQLIRRIRRLRRTWAPMMAVEMGPSWIGDDGWVHSTL